MKNYRTRMTILALCVGGFVAIVGCDDFMLVIENPQPDEASYALAADAGEWSAAVDPTARRVVADNKARDDKGKSGNKNRDEKNDKRGDNLVEICHIPPGNPDARHTIMVAAAAVPAHLAHGDVLGACPVEDTDTDTDGDGVPDDVDLCPDTPAGSEVDPNGCVLESSLSVDAGSDVTVAVGGTAVLGGSPTASGGTGGYAYAWSPVTGLNDVTAANPVLTGLAEGTFMLTLAVIDSAGMTATDTVTVTVLPAPWTPHAVTVEQTLTVGRFPYAMAISPDGSRLYVSNYTDDTVSVVRVADAQVELAIPVGDGPRGVAVSPDGRFLYVCHAEEDTLAIIQASDHAVVDTIFVGFVPDRVAVSPDNLFVYVTLADDQVAVMRASDHVVIATVPVGSWPMGVATSPDGRYVFVSNYSSNTVSVISTSDHAVVQSIAVGARPSSVVTSPDAAYVYVANVADNTVSVIRTADFVVVKTIAVGRMVWELAASRNGLYVYATNYLDATITVIQTSDFSVIDMVPVGEYPKAIAVSPDSSTVYVANEQSMSVRVVR